MFKSRGKHASLTVSISSLKLILEKPNMVVNAFNLIGRVVKTGESLNLRPALTTEGIPGQAELQRETLSQKQNKQQ